MVDKTILEDAKAAGFYVHESLGIVAEVTVGELAHVGPQLEAFARLREDRVRGGGDLHKSYSELFSFTEKLQADLIHYQDAWKNAMDSLVKVVAERDELRAALMELIALYVANEGTDAEFIRCITPKHVSALTATERKQNECWSAWDNARALIAKHEGK